MTTGTLSSSCIYTTNMSSSHLRENSWVLTFYEKCVCHRRQVFRSDDWAEKITSGGGRRPRYTETSLFVKVKAQFSPCHQCHQSLLGTFEVGRSGLREEQAESEHVLRTVLPQHCRTALGVHEELSHVPEKKMIGLQQQRHFLFCQGVYVTLCHL